MVILSERYFCCFGGRILKKFFSNPITLAVTGIFSGILSKYGDLAEPSSLFSCFGLLSSGILIWLVICTGIMFVSSSKSQSALSVAVYIFPMLASYYLYSAIVINYIWRNAIIFWLIMGVISYILAYCFYEKRYSPKFKFLFSGAACVLIIYDAIVINEMIINYKLVLNEKNIFVISIEIILAIVAFFVIKNKSEKHSFEYNAKKALT